MIPLGTVYFGEYLINQGLVELIFFDCNHGWSLKRASQYRWYQVMYQVGVFISRSSVNIVPIRAAFLPILPVLQILNALLFFFNARYFFIPHIGIVLALILIEGLLGGAAYVNTFYQIHQKLAAGENREFSIAVASFADTAGIVLSGFAAIPIHNYICRQALPNIYN